MRPAILAALICVGAAALEGTLAGRGIRQRFAELRLPRFSPPLFVWAFIGAVYYAICFAILFRLLASNQPTLTHNVAFFLVLALMAANAAWGLLFFRRKGLRASFLAFLPYGFLTFVLILTLASIDGISAALLAPYLAYLGYALWWAHRVWVLNRGLSPPAAAHDVATTPDNV